jgi:hypothetical protein
VRGVPRVVNRLWTWFTFHPLTAELPEIMIRREFLRRTIKPILTMFLIESDSRALLTTAFPAASPIQMNEAKVKSICMG